MPNHGWPASAARQNEPGTMCAWMSIVRIPPPLRDCGWHYDRSTCFRAASYNGGNGMKRFIVRAASLALLLTLPSGAHAAEEKFLKEAADHNLAEVQLGKLAS